MEPEFSRARARASGRARACVKRAAFHLLETRPEASAGQGLGIDTRLWLGPGTFLIGLGLAAPSLLLALVQGTLALYVLAVSALRLASAVVAPYASPRHSLARSDLPRLSVIVAMYDEAKVLAGLHACLSRLDYPSDRLEIIFALEACDRDTILAARSVARRAPVQVCVLPECGPRTKPRALNYALQLATGDLIAVYDAEDAPHPAQLRAAAEAFAADPELGVVQAPLNWYNHGENWLTRQFALEYAAQFNALLPLMARLGWPLPLGGTSNVFRRRALETSGGWDPFNVTEDADLGFRLARHGWRAGVITPGTREEAPISLKAWTAQRSRWLKGHMISWQVQMRNLRPLVDAAGLKGLASLQLTLLANGLSAGLHLPGLVLLIIGAICQLHGPVGAFSVSLAYLGAAAYLCAMVCAVIGARRARLPARPCDVATMPVYWLLQLPALVRALRELVQQPYL